MNHSKKVQVFILLSIFMINLIGIFSPVLLIEDQITPFTPLSDNNQIENSLHPSASDVSGSEIYSEQISVTLSANKSLIRQSYLTDDTNIMQEIDLNDPAFVGASFFISGSNGLQSPFAPSPISSSEFSQLRIIDYPLYGFLFYSTNSTYDRIQIRRSRAMDIFRITFGMDLILTDIDENPSSGYLYPFYGYYPLMNDFIETLLSNAPEDGYWKAFDKNRILSQNYQSTNHFSGSILYLNTYQSISEGMGGYSLLDLGVNTDFSFLNVTSSIFDLINMLKNSPILEGLANSGIINGSTIDDTFTSLENMRIDELLYGNMTHIVYTTIEYEGFPSAISQIGQGEYEFDLFKALNYADASLIASKKTFNSLSGIIISGIQISLISAEVYNVNPEVLYLSSSNIRQLESILFLTNIDLNISSLESYRFTIGWTNREFLSQIAIGLENYLNPTDLVNFLSLLGFTGFSQIFGAIIEPMQIFKIKYRLLTQEPFLYINREPLAPIVAIEEQNITYHIEVQNRGDYPIWGRPFDLSILNITNDPITNIITQLLGYDIPRTELYDLLESFDYSTTGIFEDITPRLFSIDSLGQGFPDTYFPDITDLTNINTFCPYSPTVADAIISHPIEFGNLFGSVPNALFFATLFDSEESIFNLEYWKLDPGEIIEFDSPILDLNFNELFTTFSTMHVRVLPSISPTIVYGQQIGINGISSTYSQNSQAWSLESITLGDQDYIQIILAFQNITNINFAQNTIDALDLSIILSQIPQINEFQLEFFNFTRGDYQIIDPSYYSLNADLFEVLISNRSESISNFYDTNGAYTILTRMTLVNSEPFNIGFDAIHFSFLDRNSESLYNSPAKIYYSTEIGANIYTTTSNSLILSNDEMSTLQTEAWVDNVSSYCGQLNQYHLNITNIGNQPAYNIEIRVDQPGIIDNSSLNRTYSKDNFKNQYTLDWGDEGIPTKGEIFSGNINVIPNFQGHKSPLNLSDDDNNGTSKWVYPFLTETTGWISYWASVSSGGGAVFFTYSDNGPVGVGPAVFSYNNILYCFNYTDLVEIQPIPVNSWNFVVIYFDCTTDRYKLWIDNEYINEFHFNSPLTSINYLIYETTFYEFGYSSYLDAVYIGDSSIEATKSFNGGSLVKQPPTSGNNEFWILNVGDYFLDQGVLITHIPYLAPGETISDLNFSFFTPNSREINGASVSWDDYRNRVDLYLDYQIISNNIYLSAPIFYNSSQTRPFIHEIELIYLSPTSANPPPINELFEVQLQVKNIGSTTINYFTPNLATELIGLKLNSTQNITINQLAPKSNEIIHLYYNKTDVHGYFLPAIQNKFGIVSQFTQILPSTPLILGIFQLNLHKTIETQDAISGTRIDVTVRLQNLGNIPIGQFLINDIWSYDANGFTLVDGQLISEINYLDAGKETSFTYTLLVLKQGWYNITPAWINYYFLYQTTVLSEEYVFKVRDSYWLLTLRIYGPMIIGFTAIYSIYRLKMQYNKEDLELERRESLLFGQNLRDTAWAKKNIIEFLDEQKELIKSEKLQEKHFDSSDDRIGGNLDEK